MASLTESCKDVLLLGNRHGLKQMLINKYVTPDNYKTDSFVEFKWIVLQLSDHEGSRKSKIKAGTIYNTFDELPDTKIEVKDLMV